MWAQRSRLLWARQGDRNTKYFHSYAIKRYRKNLIGGVRDDEGICKVHLEEIAPVFVDYYKTLFSSSGHIEVSRVLECVPTMIMDEMNSLLCRAFEASEVNVTLQQMTPLKAPRPDVLPPLFYQHF